MVALLTIGMLVGCSSKEKDAVTGKWTMTKAVYGGVEQTASQLQMSMTLDFKDGKVKIVTESEASEAGAVEGESEYTLDGNTVTITDADGTETVATVDGDTMTLTQSNVEFTLVKGDGDSASDSSDTETTPAADATPEAETDATPGADTEATPAAE